MRGRTHTVYLSDPLLKQIAVEARAAKKRAKADHGAKDGADAFETPGMACSTALRAMLLCITPPRTLASRVLDELVDGPKFPTSVAGLLEVDEKDVLATLKNLQAMSPQLLTVDASGVWTLRSGNTTSREAA